ncbi:hypothetical protein WKK_02745 [Weissella koreensis KACC 15510]|uniref:acyltransferase family protein n=1 Tax=Weissella koreensis TaxID=165096 RepID=UPI000217539E|nr:acyltransferase family protein [Weissella koreensis]AEJ23423.1 hypothetical protein WKK_02745 [Weissella koreensis KACC 15510]
MNFNKQTTAYCKAIAIILVISGHYLHLIGMDNLYTMNSGAIGVGMFLFVSGYGLEASIEKVNFQVDLSQLIRIVSLIIVYEFATILKIIITIFMHMNQGGNLKELFILGFRSDLDPTMWYMFFIIFMYCAFYVVHYLIENIFIKWIIMLICGLILAGVSHYISASFSFVLGVVAFDLRNNEKLFNVIAIILAFISSFILFGFIKIPYDFVISSPAINMTILVVFVPICCMKLLNNLSEINGLDFFYASLKQIAKLSFALYLFEVFGFSNPVFSNVIVNYRIWGILSYLFILLVVAYLFTNYIVKPLNYRNLTDAISGLLR